MARYFLDTSALIKRYHSEPGSEVVNALFLPQNQLVVSRLALVETHSAFARLVRERVLQESAFHKLTERIRADVSASVLKVVAVSSPRLDTASQLLGTLGLTSTLRTLDAIHLATAQALQSRSRLTALVAADKKMLEVAIACGLTVIDAG